MKATVVGRLLKGDTILEQIGEGLAAVDRGEGELIIRTGPGEFEVKAEPNVQKAFWIRGSDETNDRMGDVIRVKGWKLDEYKKNPVVLWAHMGWELPIAGSRRVVKDVKQKALNFLWQFPPDGAYAFADNVYTMYEGRFIRGASVGFKPIKWEEIKDGDRVRGYEFKEQVLWEVSACPLPANPNALAQLAKAGGYTGQIPAYLFMDQKALKAMGAEPKRWFMPEGVGQAKADFCTNGIRDFFTHGVCEEGTKSELEGDVILPPMTCEELDPRTINQGIDDQGADDTASVIKPKETEGVKDEEGPPKARWLKIPCAETNGLLHSVEGAGPYAVVQKRVPLDEKRGVYLDLYGLRDVDYMKEDFEGQPTSDWLILDYVFDLEKWDREAAVKLVKDNLSKWTKASLIFGQLMAEGKTTLEMLDKLTGLEHMLKWDDTEPPGATDLETKPEETEDFIHIPVRDEEDFKPGTFKTVDISKDKGIKAVMGKLKKPPSGQEGSMVTQKYLFEKAKGWTMAKAKKWVKEHKKFCPGDEGFDKIKIVDDMLVGGNAADGSIGWGCLCLWAPLVQFTKDILAEGEPQERPALDVKISAEGFDRIEEKIDEILSALANLQITAMVRAAAEGKADAEDMSPATDGTGQEEGSQPSQKPGTIRLIKLVDGQKPEAKGEAPVQLKDALGEIAREAVKDILESEINYQKGVIKYE